MYSDIRSWLIEISHSVKLGYYCRMLGIHPGNLTHFMKGYDRALSLDNLIRLCDLIRSDLSEKIA